MRLFESREGCSGWPEGEGGSEGGKGRHECPTHSKLRQQDATGSGEPMLPTARGRGARHRAEEGGEIKKPTD